MAASQKGLGRGLGALFRNDDEVQKKDSNTGMLAINSLVPNAGQPRKHFDETPLKELAESIKSQGILQPILVRPLGPDQPNKYEIVAGERRFRAAQLADLREVPVIIKELDDQEALAIALIENLQREDLNPMEEALGIHKLKSEFSVSQEDLAKRLGKSRSAVANSLRLLNLSPAAQEDLQNGKISAGHARAILSLDGEKQDLLRLKIIEEKLSVRETEALSYILKNQQTEENAKDNAESDSGQPAEKKAPRPLSAIVMDLQERLQKSVSLPVRVSGRETKGKISISYSSKDELNSLLARLGLEEGV